MTKLELFRRAWRDPEVGGYMRATLALYGGAMLLMLLWVLGYLREEPSVPPRQERPAATPDQELTLGRSPTFA